MNNGDKGENICRISLETFRKHFAKLSQINAENDSNIENKIPDGYVQCKDEDMNPHLNNYFSIQEVQVRIKKLKNRKACGIDNIINEFLKNCPYEMIVIITKIFNIVLDTGLIPTEWCIGMIKPLFKKKGSTMDPDNYRGITLLSCLAKLFTSCLNSRLTNFLENKKELGEEQAGFREGYSTLDHIFVLHSLIDFYLDKNKRIYCLFVDYKKAFDLVDRSSLWCKLLSHGINGKIFQVIFNMYRNAKSCVKQNNTISNFFDCTIGVRQGENLSPMLFAIYLNDFERSISKNYNGLDMCSTDITNTLFGDDIDSFIRLYTLLYADDTIVLAESANDLQIALDNVHEYCDLWKLSINISKTKIVIFSRGKVRKYAKFTYGKDEVQVVDDYVYLGTTFNYNGKMDKAIDKQITQASRAMYSMLTKCKRLALPVDIQCNLFDNLVMPILLYGSEIWGHTNVKQIEMFYKKFLKSLLQVKRNTGNCMVYGELGKFGVLSTIEKRMVNFWMRVVHGKQSKLSYIIYLWLRKLHDNGIYKSSWMCKIKNILENCGYSNVWENPLDFSPLWLKQSISLKLNDIDKQNWLAEVDRNKLCMNYRLLKREVGLEKYLVNLDFVHWINIVKFKCGNHFLPINKGRYGDVSHDTMCTLCNTADIGDEYHYVLECPAIKKERKMYIKPYYFENANVLKFNQLFNVKSKKQLCNLSKFLRHIMSLHKP